MKKFIERFKEAFKYEWVYDEESFPMKILVGVFTAFYMLFGLAFILVTAVTVPLWGIPYIIYCIRRNKE
jgi:hypothetical protein